MVMRVTPIRSMSAPRSMKGRKKPAPVDARPRLVSVPRVNCTPRTSALVVVLPPTAAVVVVEAIVVVVDSGAVVVVDCGAVVVVWCGAVVVVWCGVVVVVGLQPLWAGLPLPTPLLPSHS
jgi:hypothetical protein